MSVERGMGGEVVVAGSEYGGKTRAESRHETEGAKQR